MKDLAIQREEEMQEDTYEMFYPRIDSRDMDDALEWLSILPYKMAPGYAEDRATLIRFLNYLEEKYGLTLRG